MVKFIKRTDLAVSSIWCEPKKKKCTARKYNPLQLEVNRDYSVARTETYSVCHH